MRRFLLALSFVLMPAIALADIEAELTRREGVSGIAEKTARKG